MVEGYSRNTITIRQILLLGKEKEKVFAFGVEVAQGAAAAFLLE
jgi:hypothetical protein